MANFFCRSRDQDDDKDTPPLIKRASPSVPTASPEFTPSPEPTSPLSQEQRLQIEDKKLEAESKLVAKRFGAERLGLSWFKALRAEFKKSYIQKVPAV